MAADTGSIMVESGRIAKMEVDYSAYCDEKIPECKKMAAEGKMHDALETLLALEKHTRTGADMISTGRILVAIVQICFEAKNYEALNEHITLLAKLRLQLKQAVVKMVEECCTYVDLMPTKEAKLKLIDTLRSVTEGKIYVEVERARLTHKLAQMKEEEGNITEAAYIIRELQVETYGSMEKREKVKLMLEQMRLSLAENDFIRTQFIKSSLKKINKLMKEPDGHQGMYLSTCRHYRAVTATPSVQVYSLDDLWSKQI